MDKIQEIKEEIKRLQEQAGKSFEAAKITIKECDIVDASWSGSDLVGHADLFYGGFEPPPLGNRFSVELGLIHGVPDGWHERDSDEVRQKIESVSKVSLEDLDKNADVILERFDELRKEAVIALSSISKNLAEEAEKFNLETKVDIFNQYWNRQIVTRDTNALYAGRKIPVHKYYWATATFLTSVKKELNEFLYLLDKLIAQSTGSTPTAQSEQNSSVTYIDKKTLLRLSKIQNKDFDLSRLISFCNELNDNFSLGNYHSCAMLLRAIIDHVPPVFSKTNFDDVCAQHGGKSFKDIIRPLNETAKKVGDDYLHTQINKKVLAVTKTQVSFQANLDTLLNEVAAILEKKD